MSPSLSRVIAGIILLFHLFITAHGFYTMFSDYQSWEQMMINPFLQLLFTLIWSGIWMGKRVFGFAYFLVVLFEILIRVFFIKSSFGKVFGDIFFPADLIFTGLMIIMYKPLFGERSTQ
ncbi:MAG: hypothetical protein KBF25_10060 [Chitinophagaceae bacterium]|jgi:hypothetical protein|nr:hypothetical protein [Chitinophagaceae bacterium]